MKTTNKEALFLKGYTIYYTDENGVKREQFIHKKEYIEIVTEGSALALVNDIFDIVGVKPINGQISNKCHIKATQALRELVAKFSVE